MSNLSNIQNATNFSNLDGLSVINADEIYIDGQKVNLEDYIPYQNATKTVNLNSQNIQSTYNAAVGPDLVNLTTQTNSVTYIDTANALTYLNKITSSSQSVASYVTFNDEITALTILKMNALTANRVTVLNNDKQLVASGISITKLDYLDNVSSDIQTQLNGTLK